MINNRNIPKDLAEDLVPEDVDDEALEKSQDKEFEDEEGPLGHMSNQPADLDKLQEELGRPQDSDTNKVEFDPEDPQRY